MQSHTHFAGWLLSPAAMCCMGSMDCRALGRGPQLDQCERAFLRMLSGRFQKAEDEFMKAGKPREAIDMWCHQQDWAAALSVAERCDPQSVPDIQAAQVGLAATAGPEQEPAFLANGLCIYYATSCGWGLPLLEILSGWQVAGAAHRVCR